MKCIICPNPDHSNGECEIQMQVPCPSHLNLPRKHHLAQCYIAKGKNDWVAANQAKIAKIKDELKVLGKASHGQ